MDKALEAFYKIKAGYICGQGAINEFALRYNERELLDTIEAALKRSEELEIENSEQFKEKWVQDNLAMTFELNVARGELKVLDIIKKEISDCLEFYWDEEHDYGEVWCIQNEEESRVLIASAYNKEEFNLLKKVLLCE